MARVRLNRTQIDLLVRQKGRSLVQGVTDRVQTGARALIPVGDHLSGSGKRHTGPTLLSSVYSRVSVNAQEAVGVVGAKAKHAATVHQGSQAHTIRSKRGKVLKFRWERGDFLVAARRGKRRGNRRTGQFHYFMRVRHPGNKRPVQYLVTPLHMFARMSGFKTSSVAVGRSRLP